MVNETGFRSGFLFMSIGVKAAKLAPGILKIDKINFHFALAYTLAQCYTVAYRQ